VKKIIKSFANKTLQPVIRKYLSKTRVYHYKGIKLSIPREVFHPAFFFSTRVLLQSLVKADLPGKTLLELGAGSGLISFIAKQNGAIVTATDINETAILNLHKNGVDNNLQLNIILSDLFKNIPLQKFDIIAINPPYYKKQAVTETEYAWYCGENGEYFTNLFRDLSNYIHQGSLVLIILSDECDIEMINKIAASFHFQLALEKRRRIFWEVFFLYQVVFVG